MSELQWYAAVVREELGLLAGLSRTRGWDRSFPVQPGLLRAEWVPPSEVPPPIGPAEVPEPEPEEPVPGPAEVPVEPEEPPSEPPPEVRQ